MAVFQALLAAGLVALAHTDVFTSCHKLREMALNEDVILSAVKENIDEQYRKLEALSKAYEDFKEESRPKEGATEAYDLNHPNGLFLVIKRFARRYQSVLGPTIVREVRKRLRQAGEQIPMANDEDYNGALRALLRLQEVYNLTVSDMVRGDYRGHPGPGLSFEDAYDVGKIAFTDAKLDQSESWLKAALDLRSKDPMVAEYPRTSPTIGAIMGLLGRTYAMGNRYKEAEDIFQEANADDPGHGDVITLAAHITNREVLKKFPPKDYKANYTRLCQYPGPYKIEFPDYKAMKCRYKPTIVPYYAFKEEILSVSPYVSLFYGIFTEDEKQHLKENVYNSLTRGYVGFGSAGDPSRKSNIRTSDLAWLPDAANSKTALMSRRITLVTGLEVKQQNQYHPQSGEDFQVVNYGLAGHYEVHLDPNRVADGSGFRIATFLIYLNDVIEGGSTVFTKAGISVSPDKDTVLFWYNFPPAFDNVDDLTNHAGCPVLVGQKWIANKWIRSYGNAYHRPCGLDPDLTQLDIEPTMLHNQRHLFQR